MKKEYKELFDNIKPDSELMYDTFNKADENKKSTVFMPRKIVAVALVMAALAVGSGFGIHQIKEPKAIEDIENTTHTMDDLPSSDFFTITAFASDDENAEIKTLSPDNITLIDYKIELKKDSYGYYVYSGTDTSPGIQVNADDIKQVIFRTENGSFNYLDTPLIGYKESLGEYYAVRLPITKEEATEYLETIENGDFYNGYTQDFIHNIMNSRDCSSYFGDNSTDLDLYSIDYSDEFGVDEFLFRNKEEGQQYMQFNKSEIAAKAYPGIDGVGSVYYSPDQAIEFLVNNPETPYDELPTDEITIIVEFNSGQTVTQKLSCSFAADGTLMFCYID